MRKHKTENRQQNLLNLPTVTQNVDHKSRRKLLHFRKLEDEYVDASAEIQKSVWTRRISQ